MPRWNMPEVNFTETDAQKVQDEIFAAYTAFTGRTLANGDPVRLFLLSIASIIIQQRAAINYAGQQNLLSYADGSYLDALGLYMGVSRLPASFATAMFKFTLSTSLAEAYQVPAGTAITNGVVTFTTDAAAYIPAGGRSVETRATCKTAGSSGNGYAVGEIDTMEAPLAFISSVSNTTETSGGSDEEDDETFAERIKIAPNGFSVAGPKKAYIYHAKSVNPSIIDVAVITPSAGVVDVYILTEDGVALTSELISQVQDYLSSDTVRPLTDKVTVKEPVYFDYEIKVEYRINESDRANAATIQTRVSDAVESYRVWQSGKIGRDLDPERLVSLVKDAGAGNIVTLEPAFNDYTVLSENTVARCTGVTVNFLGFKAD